MRRSGNLHFGLCIGIVGLFLYVLAMLLKNGTHLAVYITVIVFSATMLLFGVFQIILWFWDMQTKKLGVKAVAEIVYVKTPKPGEKLSVTGKTYPVIYEYVSSSDKKRRYKTYLSKSIADELHAGDKINVLLYKERAVIDYKKIHV